MYVKLLQWNIWYKEKIKNVHRLIRDINPDIICIQEATVNSDFNPSMNTAERLAELLRLDYFYKDAQKWTEHNKEEQGNAILSKFPIINKYYQYLKEPEDNTKDWSKEGRVYLEATLDMDGTDFTVATTHLSYPHRFNQTPEKKEEVDKLAEIMKQKKEKYILTGDFNSGALSYTIDKFSDILKNAGPDLTLPTWTTKPFDDGLGFIEDQLKWRLDYVFASHDVKIRKSKIVNTEYSDHLPILIGFEI